MTATTKLTLYILGGAVLVIAAYLLLLQPALARVSELAESERATKAEVARLEKQILAYKTAQSDLSKASGKDLLYSITVDDKNLYVPIEEMEAGADKTGTARQLKILKDSLVPNPAKRGAPETAQKVTEQTALEEVPYALSIQNADYKKLVSFFQYLENIPHFTEISKVGIIWNENGTEGESAGLNATINGVWLAKPNAN